MLILIVCFIQTQDLDHLVTFSDVFDMTHHVGRGKGPRKDKKSEAIAASHI